VALAYLIQPADSEFVSLAEKQFEHSDNMTDTGAALRALVNSAAPAARAAKEAALTHFYNRWVDEALVIDQWFQIQAASPLPDTLERVEALMHHPAYTLKNPNRARALIAPFTANLVNFHQRSGDGYRFLADRVIDLNAQNPMIAARILSPLTRWRKFDESRQRQMRAELERILATDNLSPDVFEVVTKSI
jgi:aminopeptidase N